MASSSFDAMVSVSLSESLVRQLLTRVFRSPEFCLAIVILYQVAVQAVACGGGGGGRDV